MGAYGPNVTVEDRWAIIAYVRTLASNGVNWRPPPAEDVPEPAAAPYAPIQH